MPTQLPAGPYRQVPFAEGRSAPFYIIPFDRQGRCDGPLTRDHLLATAQAANATDIFVFSHGWNNDWTLATQRYEEFLDGFLSMRRSHSPQAAAECRPLLVGIFWPSTALVFGEGETGPAFAGDVPDVAQERLAIDDLAAQLDPADVDRFVALLQKPALTSEEALELANIAAPIYSQRDDELPSELPTRAEDILATWHAAARESRPPSFDDFGTVGSGPVESGPQAAGLWDNLEALAPRNVLRLLTVRQMKDRAGKVGAHGVGPLVRDLLVKSNARIHLVGHSYGCKVVLSAVGYGDALPRRVHSILLLQPAVSHLCFAANVAGSGRSGGYHNVLQRVVRPIVATFSANDGPLTRFYHYALRRDADLGDARIAGVDPPSQYAALGGFGPRDSDEVLINVNDAGVPYSFSTDHRLYGINATRTISGHSDISNGSTWWLLHSLMQSTG